MTFLYGASLFAILLLVAPLVAHFLTRKRTDVRDFPPAHMVPPSAPIARQRRRIDDRLLFVVRALAIALLAVLGAVPFVRCSGLSIGRQGGASVALAIVLDDSLSMQAEQGGASRWQRAVRAAKDLVAGAREGDAVGVVLAGDPPRIALSPTTDLGAARTVLDAARVTDRATDLAGAIEIARSLLDGLPQVDRRVVLLSDRADGRPDALPLSGAGRTPLWAPLPDLAGPASDCAVLRADRQHSRVSARVICSPPAAGAGRLIELRSVPDDTVVASAPLSVGAATDAAMSVPDAARELVARLTGKDDIAADDALPVLTSPGPMSVAVVADPALSKLVTGGPPAVEQALSALGLDIAIRPLPGLPDRSDDLGVYGGIVLEDPAGFTPEERRSLGAWLERGGVALLALGPHAALVSLGAGFEPLLVGPVRWGPSPAAGLDDRGAATLGASAKSLADLAPQGRASIDAASLGAPAKTVLLWKDGAPFWVERPVGRGLSLVLTLPFTPDASDLPLRPAFLALLDTFVEAARARSGAHRTDVGEPWVFDAVGSLEVKGPTGASVPVRTEASRKLVTPDRIGLYRIVLDDNRLTRVAAPAEREIDFRPHPLDPAATGASLGEVRAKVGVSPYVAVLVLALLVCELALRLLIHRASPGAGVAPRGGT